MRKHDPILDVLAAMTDDDKGVTPVSDQSEEELVAGAEALIAEAQAAIERTGLRPRRADLAS